MAERRYRIQKAAELSGVSEELIRAWERRYSVLSPERTEAGYRLYNDEDVAVLKRLRLLSEEGVPIREAAKTVASIRLELARARARGAGREPGLDLSTIERWRAQILDAAEQLDQFGVDRTLDEALGTLPPLVVFDELMVPSMREVGERWHAGRLSVAQEHLVTQAVRGRVISMLHAAPSGLAPMVVCACFPEEQHELGALGAALRLRHAGYRVTWLGQRTPADALGRMVEALGPAAVALSAVTDPGEQAFEETVRLLRQKLPAEVPVVVGGRAAQSHRGAVSEQGFLVFDEGGWDAVLRAVTGEGRGEPKR